MYECARPLRFFFVIEHPEAELGPSPGESGDIFADWFYFKLNPERVSADVLPDRFVDKASDELSRLLAVIGVW